MRILITGASGQVGHSIALAISRNRTPGMLTVSTPTRNEFNLDNPDALAAKLDGFKPDLIVNAAAWTQVDLAQGEPEAAWRANAASPRAIAQWCARHQVGLIHFSTDYVFDGKTERAYRPKDATHPLGEYGASKLAGEQAILESGAAAVILRTSWVMSPFGRNFLLTMLGLFAQREVVGVVADQYGTPTSAPAIASWFIKAILEPIADGLKTACTPSARVIANDWLTRRQGVYHLSGEGVTSWHGVAQFILDRVRATEGDPAGGTSRWKTAEVRAISTDQYPTPTPRPAFSALDCNLTREVFGVTLGPWQTDLAVVVSHAIDKPRS
jgi:dTDP-4-dehydrorhamnose reductase